MTWRGPVEITPAGHEHLDELVPMIGRDAAEGSYAHLEFDPDITRETVADFIDRSTRTLLLAVGRQDILGFIAGQLSRSLIGPDVVAEEVAFYVRPEYRGGRTAVLLARDFSRWAVQHDARRIVMGNAAGMNDKAYTKLLKRFGFQQMGSIMVMEV